MIPWISSKTTSSALFRAGSAGASFATDVGNGFAMMKIRVQSANTAYICIYHLGQNCTCNKNEDAMEQNDHGNKDISVYVCRQVVLMQPMLFFIICNANSFSSVCIFLYAT